MIRNAASQDIVAFLGILEPRNWPACLQHLVLALDSPDSDTREVSSFPLIFPPSVTFCRRDPSQNVSLELIVSLILIFTRQNAFNTLEKACEDYPRKLDVDINGTRPLDFMIPKFLSLSEHPSAKMRAHAIACLSFFVPVNCQSLFVHIDTFIACLFKRASDEDASVRRHVCQALVLLLAARPEKLMPEMSNVAQYMLYSTKDKHENVALEACEFWLTFAEDQELAPYLHPLLDQVAPTLLDCMVYGEDDLLWLEADAAEDNASVPDKESDIKPRHYGGKTHGFEREGGPGEDGSDGSKTKVGAYGQELLDEEDEDYEDYDDDEFADEMTTEWNLRKCAAAALDVLAVRFQGDLLRVLLGPLKEKLWSADWLQRESGILALGAMAEGLCSEACCSVIS